MAVRPILSNQAKNPLLDQYNAVQANNNKRKKTEKDTQQYKKTLQVMNFCRWGILAMPSRKPICQLQVEVQFYDTLQQKRIMYKKVIQRDK